MSRLFRANLFIVGIAILWVSLSGWAMNGFLWGFKGIEPHMIREYDLRPFVFASDAAQVWFPTVVSRGLTATVVAGLVLIAMGIKGGRGRRPALAAAVVTGVVALALQFVSGSRFRQPGAVPVASLSGFERLSKLQFPPGTLLLEARYEGGLDPAYIARVTMPRDTVEAFARGGLVAAVSGPDQKPPALHLSRTECPTMGDDGAGMADWHPERAKRFLAATATVEERMQTAGMLADLDNPGSAVVYVIVMR